MLASQTERYKATEPFTKLLYASSIGDLQQITDLIEKGVDVNDFNEIGQTALLVASLSDKLVACELLLKHGAKVDHSDIGGYTALHLTTDADITRLLLSNINEDKKNELVNARTKFNITPLHEAAYRDCPGKVFALLSENADVNSEDTNKSTPLHYAVARSEVVDATCLVEALIEAGADVNKQNIYLQTALAIACKQHQFMRKIITILLKSGADPAIQASDGNTALHVLFLGTNLFEPNLSIDAVEEVVEANKKCLKMVNLYGELPLHGALSRTNNEDIVMRLLEYGPDTLECKDNLGKTILHYACEKDYLCILDKFVENPVIVNAGDFLDRSVLHYSCMYSQDGNSVKRILQSKAFQNCGVLDCFGLSAYQYAKARPSDVFEKLLCHFEDHVTKTHCNCCRTPTTVLRKYSEVFVSGSKEKLSSLLTQMVVITNDILPSNLRPVANAEDYVNQIWNACTSPCKDSENFEKQKRKVEHFMKHLIMLMKEYDERFSGNLVMRGSAYEGTIADERGDFDYMLDISGLGSICGVRETDTDPPGFVRMGLQEGKDPGMFKDFFDSDGLLRSEIVLSKFSLAAMQALHQPSLWRTCGFDFFPELTVTWKDRPALSIRCRVFHLNTFIQISIDFLPALHCGAWWPSGFDCHGFLNQRSLEFGCQMIIKPPNVPFYQHTHFGKPHQYMKMSFSEAETNIFHRSNPEIRQAFIVAKLLLDREAAIPWNLFCPTSGTNTVLSNGSLWKIKTKNILNSFLLKQSLLHELREHQFHSENDSVLVWVRRIFGTLHRSLKEGHLGSIFLSNFNFLHTFQPDDSLENLRNVVIQIIYHSLLQDEIPLVIDRNVRWHRSVSKFEIKMHSKFRYLNKTLQSPEERE